jgi:hypothetical protein
MNSIQLDLTDFDVTSILRLAIKNNTLTNELSDTLTSDIIDRVSTDFLETGEFFATIEINQNILFGSVGRAKKQIEIDLKQQLKMSLEG